MLNVCDKHKNKIEKNRILPLFNKCLLKVPLIDEIQDQGPPFD